MAEAVPLPPLSEAELGIMNAIWDRGEATVAEVWGSLRERRGVARNTILTQMDRLVEKGWLIRDSGSHAHRDRAAVLREAGAMQVIVARAPDENAVLEALDRAIKPSSK